MKCARCTESEISAAFRFIYRVRMKWCHNHCSKLSFNFNDKCIMRSYMCTCMCVCVLVQFGSSHKKSSINIFPMIRFNMDCFSLSCFCYTFSISPLQFRCTTSFITSHTKHHQWCATCMSMCVYMYTYARLAFVLKFSFYMMFQAVYCTACV